jgi:Spy/CpxP family protein refolding chaperone
MTIVRAIAAATLCLSLTPCMVLAQGEPLDPLQAAGASPDQQKRIRQLSMDFQKKIQGELAQRDKLMDKMNQISLEPLPDEKAMRAVQGDINKVLEDAAGQRIQLLMDIRNVLNPDQRKKLVDFLKAHPARVR